MGILTLSAEVLNFGNQPHTTPSRLVLEERKIRSIADDSLQDREAVGRQLFRDALAKLLGAEGYLKAGIEFVNVLNSVLRGVG